MNYKTLPGLRWSLLKHILHSPRHLKHAEANPLPDSPARRWGRTVHCAVLEPQRFAAEAIDFPAEHLTPSGAVSTSKATTAWLSSLRDNDIVLSAEQRDTCARIVDALQAHEEAANLLHFGTMREHVLRWVETIDGVDVQCKMQADLYAPKLRTLVDLKIVGGMGRFTPRKVRKIAVAENWTGQMGFYKRGLIANEYDVDEIAWICVEATAPHDIIVMFANGDMVQCCDELADEALVKYAHCVGSGNWHGVAPERVILEPPAWMLASEGDAADLELEFAEVE